MMPFLLLAAGMVLLALALVLVPLLRKSTTETAADTNLTVLGDALRELESEHTAGRISASDYRSAHTELQRRALQAQHEGQQRAASGTRSNWGAALTTAISLPLITVLLYVAVGTPGALRPQTQQQPLAAGAGSPHVSDSDAIAALEQRMAANASDVDGWVLLARSYAQTRRFVAAAQAYAKAAALEADNPDLLIEYANALAISQDRDLSGEPERLVQRALKINPEHPDALAFAGLAAFQRDDRPQALTYWRRLEALLPPGSEDRTRVELFIARAQANDTAANAAAPQATGSEQKGIRGSVTIAPDLAARVTKGDTLFIFARATGGPPMPIAAVRTQTDTWPVNFALDDSSAMAAGAALSRFANVNIVARVSRSGSVTAEPGDIEGTVGNVAVGSQGVQVVMDRVVER